MDSQLIQRTRYQLQMRVRTTKTCPPVMFPNACKHLLDWIEASPFLRHLLDPVRSAARNFKASLEGDLAKRGTAAAKEIIGPLTPDGRHEAVALYWAALQVVTGLDLSDPRRQDRRQAHLLAFLVGGYAPDGHPEFREAVEVLRDVAVQGLYDHVDEAVDGRNAVLGLLLKYKQRCETYRRSRLREAAEQGLEGRDGERALAYDLYEYLHDQGVDFWIESTSASGEPDLVSRDAGGQRLVADAKYIRPNHDHSKMRRTVASGFRQVLEYCRDHNEPVGYLVVFVNRDVILDLKAERDDGFPCFRTGGYTVYYVVIDVFGHADTASHRPKPPVLEVTQEQLVALVQDETAASPI